MKIIIILALTLLLSNLSLQQDFYGITPCPDFDNSRYVKNLDIKFTNIPTQGIADYATVYGDAV